MVSAAGEDPRAEVENLASSNAAPALSTPLHKRVALLEPCYPQSELPFPWLNPWTIEFRNVFLSELKQKSTSNWKINFLPIKEIIMADRDRESFRQAVYAKNLLEGREYDVLIGLHEMSCMALRDTYDRFVVPNILLCSYIDITPEFQKHFNRISGVTLTPNYKETLSLGLKLLPEAQEILFITDDEDADPRISEDSMEWILQTGGHITPFQRREDGSYLPARGQGGSVLSRANITWVRGTECNTDEMLEAIRNLPPRSFIVLSNWRNYYRDGVSTFSELVSKINALGHPVFTFSRVFPQGAVGGYIPRAETCAKKMASLVEEIFESPLETVIPSCRVEGELVVDMRAMKRFGLSASRLPPGAILLNQRQPVWVTYPEETLVTVAVFGMVLSLLVILYILHRRFVFYTRRTETLLNVLPIRVCVADEQGNLLFHQVEGEVRDRVGSPKTLNDLLGVNGQQFAHGVSLVFKTKQPFSDHYEHWGRKRMVHFIYLDEKILGKKAVMWFSQDVTELEEERNRSQKLTQERLRFFESLRYSSELARLSFFQYHRDPSTHKLVWDPPSEVYAGWKMFKKEPVSEEGEIIPEDIAKFKKAWDEFESGQTRELRLSYRSLYKDALRYYSLIAVWNQDNVLGAIQDVTQMGENERKLKEAMYAAQAADRAKTYFVSTISHELRTPLNSVIGFCEVLQMGDIDPKDQQEYLSAILSSGNNLLDLVNDLLDLSKMESDQFIVYSTKTDLNALFKEIHTFGHLKALDRKLSFDLKISPETLPLLYLDERRFKQVLLNLLSNALKFTHEGGISVCVEFLPQSSLPEEPSLATLHIRVSDTGIGIKKEFLKKIFDPFVQANEGNVRGTRPYEGTGLGLAISKKIINKMGGALSVTSQEGKGTTFTIELKDIRYEHSN